MRILSIVIALFFLAHPIIYSLPKSVRGMNYTLLSFQNKKSNVNIKYNIVTSRILIELTPDEVLCINGCRGFIDNARVLDQRFIELHFSMLGGTGVKLQRYVLICISKNKLYRALDILSLIDSQFNTTFVEEIDSLHLYDERSIKRFKLLGLVKENNSYQLKAEEYYFEKSKQKKYRNYKLMDTIVLTFDLERKIFYEKINNIYGNYIIDADDLSISHAQVFMNGNYPMIGLNSDEYYFINNEWYLHDQKDHLTIFKDRCNK